MNLMTAYAKTLSNDGIIAQLWDYLNEVGALEDAPYLGDRNTAQVIDNYYYYAWSGDKLIAPMVRKLYDYENDLLPAERMRDIAEMFWAVNRDNLWKMWGLFTAQYDPVNNYHIIEHTDYLHTGETHMNDSGSDSTEKQGTATRTKGGGHTNVKSGDVQTMGSSYTHSAVWGFDSTTAADDNQTVTTVGKTPSGASDPWKEKYNNVTDKLTYNSETDTESFTGRKDVTTYGKKRAGSEGADDDLDISKDGNLGVMPTAQILQAEVDFWAWNFYKNVLFKALDETLTIPIY